MKLEKIIQSTLKKGVLTLPKDVRDNKEFITKYDDLAYRAWVMTVSTILNSPNTPSKDKMERIHHSIKVAKLVYRIGKDEIKDSKILVELQIAALMHDMFKFHNESNHAEQASLIAKGLGLSDSVAEAIANHSNSKIQKSDIATLVLIDADNLSKLTPEQMLGFLRSKQLKEKMERKRKYYTKTGKEVFKIKLKELKLLEEILDIEKSVFSVK